MTGPPKPGWVLFTEMCLQLGLTRSTVKQASELCCTKDRDWIGYMGPGGKQTYYSPAAREILAAYLRQEFDVHTARKALAGEVPQPAPIVYEDVPPPVDCETVTVVSRPRLWPDGSVKHFPNPRVVQCKRADGQLIHVRVPKSGHYTPTLRSGEPMTLRASWRGEPRNWVAIDLRGPRWIGQW